MSVIQEAKEYYLFKQAKLDQVLAGKLTEMIASWSKTETISKDILNIVSQKYESFLR